MSSPVKVSLEPERYELKAAPLYRFDLDRREFFKFLGAGILVVSVLKQSSWSQESGGAARAAETHFPKRSMLGCILEKTAKSRSTPERLKLDRTFAPR